MGPVDLPLCSDLRPPCFPPLPSPFFPPLLPCYCKCLQDFAFWDNKRGLSFLCSSASLFCFSQCLLCVCVCVYYGSFEGDGELWPGCDPRKEGACLYWKRHFLTSFCLWGFGFLLERLLRDKGPSLPSPSSFRTGLGVPAGPLLDF